MAEDVSLGDLVSAFRLELRDGLAKMDTLGRTLVEFEGEAKARLQGVGDAGDREGNRLAQGLANGLASAGRSLASFVVGLVGVGGILEGVRRLGEAFIASNAEVDTYVNRLAGFTGGLAAAREEEQRLEDFTGKMGGKVAELVDAYVLLKQRGIDPSNKSLEALGNAAVATNMGIADVARIMSQATLDMGRGLTQFGIKMTEAAGRATFEWANASGELKRTTVSATDTMIQATLLAIWNEKYAGRMAEAATGWDGMMARIKSSFGNFLQEIGTAGAWTEFKAQLAGLIGELQALKGEELATWAKATSDVLTPIANAVASIGAAFLEVPLAAQAVGDFVGRTFANILTAMEKLGLGALQVARAMLSIMPAQKGQMEILDNAIVTMKGAIADTTFAASDLDKQMHTNLDTLVGIQQAGARAAEGYRAAAAGAKGIIPEVDETTASLNRLNSAFDEEGKTLLATYNVFNEAKLNEEMDKIVKAADDLHQHGVPANEILAALGPSISKLATTAKDFGPGFQLPEDFQRLTDGVNAGKLGMEDFARYMDDKAWKALKTGADDTVISITKAGGGIAEALKGGFGRGIDAAITDGQAKFRKFVTEMGQEKIVIAVDISDQALLDKLMRLGYTPAGMDNTGGRTRPS